MVFPTIGIVGATGAVGIEIVNCLLNSSFKDSSFRLFASSNSAGKPFLTKTGEFIIEEYSLIRARECQLVFLAVSGEFALANARLISEGDGPIVIDNSSAFRYFDEIPLVVPEINSEKLIGAKLIANPNCTTAISVMALWPLHEKYKLQKIIISTYQAASGAGIEGMEELLEGTADYLSTQERSPLRVDVEKARGLGNGTEGVEVEVEKGENRNKENRRKDDRSRGERRVFPCPLPFNLFPHIDSFLSNGYTKEEMKVVWETRKIFGLSPLPHPLPLTLAYSSSPTSSPTSLSSSPSLPSDSSTSEAHSDEDEIEDKEEETEDEEEEDGEEEEVEEDCSLVISCTAVRVPVLRAHSVSLSLQTREPLTVGEARALLSSAPGVRVIDQVILPPSFPSSPIPPSFRPLYPTPLTASHCSEVEVGRIRPSLVFWKGEGERERERRKERKDRKDSLKMKGRERRTKKDQKEEEDEERGYGLDLFVCGDQLLRGAALNAVLIAEKLKEIQLREIE